MQSLIEADGLVAIPKPLRERMGLAAGDKVDLDLESDDRLVIRKARRPDAKPLDPDRFERARGSAGPGPTTDEVMRLLRGDPDE